MYGLIAKLTVVPGKREEMIGLLKESAADMPGCFSCVVAKDWADDNVLWVTEAWDNAVSHDASLSLPAVKNAVTQARQIVSGFERVAVTTPRVGSRAPACARSMNTLRTAGAEVVGSGFFAAPGLERSEGLRMTRSRTFSATCLERLLPDGL